MPGRRQRSEVRDRRPGHEAGRGIRRQAQQFAQPASRHVFQRRHRGRNFAHHGILVPGRCKPVGRNGHRQGTADDEAEETRPCHRDRRRRPDVVEHCHRLAIVPALLGKRFVESGHCRDRPGRRGDTAIAECFAIPDAALSRVTHDFRVVTHTDSATATAHPGARALSHTGARLCWLQRVRIMPST